ncbi:MAG TPA: hypothetical protein VJV22_14515, partial [Acidobacteriaceae bacterium]|nr:hypothetical protein [Acidobacteriaceae bacterium]
MGDALSDFFPRGLPLRLKKIGNIFDDEDRSSALRAARLEYGDGHSQVYRAARGAELEFGRGHTHAARATIQAHQFARKLRGDELIERLAGQIRMIFETQELGKGAIAEHDPAGRIECYNAR